MASSIPTNVERPRRLSTLSVSIAAPIFISNGRVIGALSVASSTTRYDLDGLTSFRNGLLDTAEKIGNQASTWHFPG